MFVNFVIHLDKEFQCQKSPIMKGPLACCISVHWNVNLILVSCVSSVNFRPLFKRLRVMIFFLFNFYLSLPEVNIEEVISTFLKLAVSHGLPRNFVYDGK